MRPFLRLILLPALAVCLTALPAKIPQRIRVGVNCEFPPYEFTGPQGRPTGANLDLLKSIEKGTPFRFTFVSDDWSALRSEFDSRGIVMLAGLVRTPAREKQYLFCDPHSFIYYSAFIRRGDQLIEGWQDLNGKRILVEAGSVVEDLAREKKLNVRLLRTPNFREALQKLSTGVADAVVMPKIQGYHYISQLHLDNLMESCTLGEALPYCFALPPGYGDLREELNHVLQRLDADYELRGIQNKWFGIYSSDVSALDVHGRYFRNLLAVMISALVVMAGLIYVFIVRIRAQKKYLQLQIAERNNYEKEYGQRHQLFVGGPIVFLKWSDAKREMFESVSDNFSRFGYDPREITGGRLKFNAIVHPDDLERITREYQRRAEQNELSFVRIYRLVCPPREEDDRNADLVNTWHGRNHVLAGINLVQMRWVFDYTVVVPDESSQTSHYYGYLLEITGQKQIEAELLRQHNAAQVAINTKDTFLTSISVEINSPLNALIGLCRRIGAQELDGEQKSALQVISDSALHLKQILQQIHDFLAVLKGSIGSIPQWYVLKRLIEPIVSEFQIKISSKRIAFEHNEYQPAALVFMDADWFQKIIRVIMDNAVKFTEEGRITLSVDLARRREGRDELAVTVSDTGIGIPPDKLQLILEPFTQADETYTRKFGGIGLGLSIARNLVTQMDGLMSIDSQPGQGTCVRLSFPVETRS